MIVTTGSWGSNIQKSVPTSVALIAADVPKLMSIVGEIKATVYGVVSL